MFVLNTTVQNKLLGPQAGPTIDAAVKLLTDNAEKNPNKSIGTLKTIVLASPPPRSLLDPLMTCLFSIFARFFSYLFHFFPILSRTSLFLQC